MRKSMVQEVDARRQQQDHEPDPEIEKDDVEVEEPLNNHEDQPRRTRITEKQTHLHFKSPSGKFTFMVIYRVGKFMRHCRQSSSCEMHSQRKGNLHPKLICY